MGLSADYNGGEPHVYDKFVLPATGAGFVSIPAETGAALGDPAPAGSNPAEPLDPARIRAVQTDPFAN